MKNVTRRSFLGTAIGTGIIGSTAIAGLPILPEKIQGLIRNNIDQPKNIPASPVNQPSVSAYHTTPAYLHWSFGNNYRSNPMQAQSLDFQVWFSPTAERKSYNFRNEVFEKCKEIDQKRGGKPIALCYSGGESSEVIAIAMKELGIPFELYFLDTWLFNQHSRKAYAEPFAKKMGVPLHVVSISENFFEFEFLPKDFLEFGLDHPTPMLLRYLYSAIPSTHFIVTGSGNLERSGKKNEKIGKIHAPEESMKRLSWTFSPSNVTFYDWAEKNQRPGEYYFYQSSPGLLLSVLESPFINHNFPEVNLKGLIYSAFPEIQPRSKSTNWDTAEGAERLYELREHIIAFAKKNQLGFWHLSSGCTANLAGLYLA